MDRREALRTIAVASGGLVTMPAWAFGWSAEQVALATSFFSSTEERMISAIADTIIPETDSIGALAVGVDSFLSRLIEQCYDADVQENVRRQLSWLNRLAGEETGAGFPDCRPEHRQRLLLLLASSDDQEKKAFFDLMKSETIRGFRTSRVVMEQYLGYTMMPGFYDGCLQVSADH
jgi:hypothetical protein